MDTLGTVQTFGDPMIVILLIVGGVGAYVFYFWLSNGGGN